MPSNGVAKIWDGTAWVPAIIGAQGPQGDPGIDIDEGSGFADGDILVYDANWDVWVPVAKPEGGLVAVEHALFTGTQAETSVPAGGNFAVTNLSITHALSDASNKLVISAYFGAAQHDDEERGEVGIAVANDGTLVGIGDASGSRIRVGAGGRVVPTMSGAVVTMPSIMFVYAPGDTASHTYTVRGINIGIKPSTIFINRSKDDSDRGDFSRTASGFVIQEVKV